MSQKSALAVHPATNPAGAPGPARDPRNHALAYIILLFSAFGGARRAVSSDPAKSPKSCSRLHNIDIFGIRGARMARFSDPANSPKSYSRLHNITIFGIRCVRRAHFLLPTGTSKREPRNGNLQTRISKREHLNGNFQTRTPKRESPNRSLQTGTSKRESISAELQNPLTGDATTALHLRDHFVALPRVRTRVDL